MFIDTHCHIHDKDFEWSGDDAHSLARDASVHKIICVGTSISSSIAAVDYCAAHKKDKPLCYFSLALHPHEATNMDQATLERAWKRLEKLAKENEDNPQFVAIGECGLDRFYPVDQKGVERQKWLLHRHLELAAILKKPVIFHVREAFEDFWPIYDIFRSKGVLHSFSAGTGDVDQALKRPGLYFGLNGIMTFTKNQKQLDAAKKIPLSKLILETDAPFLTPKPLRGKINTPANVVLVAEFLSDLRGETMALLTDQTIANAQDLFGI